MARSLPVVLLPILLGAAVGAGGILQGLYWRRTATEVGADDRLRVALDENASLVRENESLRAMLGGGEMEIPPELIQRVEKDSGLEFRTPPVVRRATADDLRDRIAASVESHFGPAGIDDRQEAYELMGWIDGSHPLFSELTAAASVGVRGWFDDEQGEGWVTDRFRIADVPDQAVMVRLLTRILLYQHFPPGGGYAGDDADRARTALRQGLAAGAETRFYAANARAIGFLPTQQDDAARRLFATLAPFVRNLALFPAVTGKDWADSIYLKGPAAVQAALREPPRTTLAIMRPGEPAVGNPPALPAVLPADGAENGSYLGESAGALGLRLWLDPNAESREALDVALQWAGDRYQVFPDGDEHVAVIWDSVFESAASADAFEKLAQARAKVLAAALPERQIVVARIAPTRVRFLNTANAATAKHWTEAR